MPSHDDEAFVLARYPFRERHLVVVLLTRMSGQVRVLARRARGGRSPLATALEPLARVQVTYFAAPHAELANLNDASLLRSSFALAASPEAWAAGQVVAELALVYCPPGERQEPAFRLLDRCLEALLAGHGALTVACYAEHWFLKLGGVYPDLDSCIVCHRPLPGEGRVLDGREGGFVCGDHAPATNGVRADGATLAWLRAAARSPVEEIEGRPPDGVIAVLTALRRRFTEHEIRAWSYLRTVAG